MFTENNRFYSFILIVIDVAVLLLAFGGAYVLRVTLDHRPLLSAVYSEQYLLASIMVIPLWIVIFATLGLYSQHIYNRRLAEWARIAVGAFIGILIVIGWEYATKQVVFPARLVAVYALFGSFALLLVAREASRLVRSLMYRYGRGVKRVLLIGSDSTTTDIAKNLADTRRSGFEIVAIAGPKKLIPKGSQLTHFSRVEQAIENIARLNITAIIQANQFDDPKRNQQVLRASQTNHISYSFIPGESEFYSGKNTVDVFLGYPVISVHQTPLIGWGAIVKRITDLSLVIIFSPLWLAVFLLIAMLQKIFNPGPIIFSNHRIGRHGKPFKFHKFRSMKPELSGQDAVKIFEKMGRHDLAKDYLKTRKIVDDPRITRFGKFLRRSSLDEIPQLFNIIKGDMSLVGPRPIFPDEVHFYKNRGSLLMSVKPGITGLWQVSGRSDLPFESRVDLELYYAQNWSFWLDIRILFKTIKVVIFRKGAE